MANWGVWMGFPAWLEEFFISLKEVKRGADVMEMHGHLCLKYCRVMEMQGASNDA
jgi:hypothetical protein